MTSHPGLTAVLAALEAAAPGVLVRRALLRRAPPGPLVVVAVGKAATPMADAALEVLGDRVARTLVVHPEGTQGPRARRGLTACVAPHPVPDARSVEAGARALDLVAGARGPVLVLLSGGASALLAAPAPGLTFHRKRTVVASLLVSGAPIAEVNLVRRHLSSVKGGGLLRAAYPSPVHTLVVSDVIGGRRSDVGSGPSLPSPRGLRAARAAVARWLGDWPGGVGLTRCVGPSDPEARHVTSELLVSPEGLARDVTRRLRRAGLHALRCDPLVQEIGDAAESVLRHATELVAYAGPAARVFASETTLRLPRLAGERGRGGRASHLAALVGPRLPAGVSLLCLATDGVDGSSGHAGALVERSHFAQQGRALREALRDFNTGALHEALGTAVRVPLGNNLTDVVVLVRDPRGA